MHAFITLRPQEVKIRLLTVLEINADKRHAQAYPYHLQKTNEHDLYS